MSQALCVRSSMDRASDSGSESWGFESLRACQNSRYHNGSGCFVFSNFRRTRFTSEAWTKAKNLLLKRVTGFLVRLKGFEPPTFWFVAKHSIQLSYSRKLRRSLTASLGYHTFLKKARGFLIFFKKLFSWSAAQLITPLIRHHCITYASFIFTHPTNLQFFFSYIITFTYLCIVFSS